MSREEPDPDEHPIRVDVGQLVENIVAEIVHKLDVASENGGTVGLQDRAERPQIKPDLQETYTSIGPRPSGVTLGSIGSDRPLTIEDYALIGDAPLRPSSVAMAPSTGCAGRVSTATRALQLCLARLNMDDGGSVRPIRLQVSAAPTTTALWCWRRFSIPRTAVSP